MIDPARLAQLDAVFDRITQTVPAKFKALHTAFVIQGFTPEIARIVAVEIIKSVLAVPAPAEQPSLPGGGE